jgi:hypothetical protein
MVDTYQTRAADIIKEFIAHVDDNTTPEYIAFADHEGRRLQDGPDQHTSDEWKTNHKNEAPTMPPEHNEYGTLPTVLLPQDMVDTPHPQRARPDAVLLYGKRKVSMASSTRESTIQPTLANIWKQIYDGDDSILYALRQITLVDTMCIGRTFIKEVYERKMKYLENLRAKLKEHIESRTGTHIIITIVVLPIHYLGFWPNILRTQLMKLDLKPKAIGECINSVSKLCIEHTHAINATRQRLAKQLH